MARSRARPQARGPGLPRGELPASQLTESRRAASGALVAGLWRHPEERHHLRIAEHGRVAVEVGRVGEPQEQPFGLELYQASIAKSRASRRPNTMSRSYSKPSLRATFSEASLPWMI